jgi:hypothetical protein
MCENDMIPKRESMLLPAVQAYFKRDYSQRATEVPFYDHRIDLYGYSSETDFSVAVELKLRNWRRALEQALVYQLCSDFVFIAVPASTARRVDLEELRTYGIGLLAVSGRRCTQELPAVASSVVNPQYKAAYTALIRE